MHELRFMGVGEPEAFRCRIYGADETEQDRLRLALVRELAGPGALETDGNAGAIERLAERGWASDEFEPAPGVDGGRFRRWRLTESGRRELTRIVGQALPERVNKP